MKIFLSLFIGVLFVFQSCKAENNLYGKWIIYKYVGGNISALSEDDAKSYIDMEFDFQPDYALINGEKFSNPKYEYRDEQALDYLFYNYKINKELIGIKDDILKVLDVSASNQVPYELFIIEDKLVINIDGVFFFLTKKAVNDEKINQSYVYCSKGDFTGSIDLTGKEKLVKLQYSFFSFPDQLTVEDTSGNILLQTPMIKTTSIKEETIDLTNKANVNQFVFKIKNKDGNKTSRWRFNVKIE